MGVIVAFFGLAFKSALGNRGSHANMASWLIIAYGLGEGIGSGAFNTCNSFTGNLTIPNSVKSIGDYIFAFPFCFINLPNHFSHNQVLRQLADKGG